MSWNASYVYGYDDADADDDYDESPSVDFMEYLRRRASCSVLPDPPPALATPAPVPKRKKSLPDPAAAAAAAAAAAGVMSREEASVLSSQRREELRRQADLAERYRANPLLYFVSPEVKAFFVRQQLTLVLMIINVSLAFMFFKLLT